MKSFCQTLASILLSAALLLGTTIYAVVPVFAEGEQEPQEDVTETLQETVVAVVIGDAPGATDTPYIRLSSEPWIGMTSTEGVNLMLEMNGTTIPVTSWMASPSEQVKIALPPSSDPLTPHTLRYTGTASQSITLTATYGNGETAKGTFIISKKKATGADLVTSTTPVKMTYNGAAQAFTAYHTQLVSKVSYRRLGEDGDPSGEFLPSIQAVGQYAVYLDVKPLNPTYVAAVGVNSDVICTIKRLELTAEDLNVSKAAADLPPDFYTLVEGAPNEVVRKDQPISFGSLSSKAKEEFTATLTYHFPDTKTLGIHSNGTVTASNIQLKNGDPSQLTLPTGDLTSPIKVSYRVEQAEIEVVPKAVSISRQPAKLSYLAGQPLDLSGLEATILYSDNSSQKIALADFAANKLTVSLSNGTALKVGDSNKAVTVALNGTTLQAQTQPLTVNKNKLTMQLTASPAEIKGGGDVTVTVKLGKTDSQSPLALPMVSEIQLTSDKKYPVKAALKGADGSYQAVFTLPDENGSGVFTATFAGNDSYAPISQSCTVTTSATPLTSGADMNTYLSKLTTPSDYQKATTEEKAVIERQARHAQDSIAALKPTEKNRVKWESLEALDNLLIAITGVQPQGSVNNLYTNAEAKIPTSGISVKGALAAIPNIKPNDQVTLAVNQKRLSSSNRELLKVDLSLNLKTKDRSGEVSPQTPVSITLPLPSGFSLRSNMVLRHQLKTGGYEELAHTINGGRGSYTITFRTNSFSVFTLYWKSNSNTGTTTDMETHFDEYTITAKAGTGGTISPSGAVRVDAGDDKTFTVKPKSGYRLVKVVVDSQKKVTLTDGKYTFHNVTEPYDIEAVFEKIEKETSSVPPAVSSKPPSIIIGGETTKPQASSPGYTPPPSSAPEVSLPEPSKPDTSSEEEALILSSEETSSEQSSTIVTDTTVSSDAEMSDSDLTVAVVIIVVVVALSLTAVFVGVYLYKKRDTDE